MINRVLALAFMILVATPAAAACGSTECKAALDVVYRYVVEQRAAYSFDDTRAWLAMTDKSEPPHWEFQIVINYVEYGDADCLSDMCSVHVTYHARGTSIPYQSFKPGYSFHDVYYRVKVTNGAAVITGDLAGWFVSGDTVIQEVQKALMPPAGRDEAALKRILVDVNEALAN